MSTFLPLEIKIEDGIFQYFRFKLKISVTLVFEENINHSCK